MSRVIVTGLIAQHRTMGGVAWDYLNFVLGLHRLGHEVYYIEDSGEWPYLDSGLPDEDWIAHDVTGHMEYLARTFEAFGLGDRWAYYFPIEGRWFGMPGPRRREVIASADILMNVSGTLDFPEKYRTVQRLVYIDTDPIFTQIGLSQGALLLKRRGLTGPLALTEAEMADPGILSGWSREEKLRRRVDLHDVHFTVGETLDPEFQNTGHAWRPTKHPIMISEWRNNRGYRDVYSTVANWTSYKPVEHLGRSYGQKDVELRRFLHIPGAVSPISLEIALAKVQHVSWETPDAADPVSASAPVDENETPHERLRQNGWRVVPAEETCGDLHSYRDYLVSSKGEWSVAKHGYVIGRSGWFSGRSACYLAAGRPVIVQDTGFGDVLPTGEGILRFTSVAEAEEHLRAVDSAYERHARAAAALADEYFDSDRVLNRMLAAC